MKYENQLFRALATKYLNISVVLIALLNVAEASEISTKFVGFHDPGIIELAMQDDTPLVH